METNKDDSRIQDNPSHEEVSRVLPFLRLLASPAIGLLGLPERMRQRIQQQATEVLREADLLTLPDRFNDAFSCHGWIATGSMSVDTMRRAVNLHDAGDARAAENTILEWFDEETIHHFAIVRSKQFNKATNRWYQLREALKLTVEERYWSAVPLILVAADGFASDVLGASPFKDGADLTAFDSIAGHRTSLPALIGLITKGVRRSSDEELNLPMRHGILHGRSLGYANRVVCMKAWLLMVALVDWAVDKSSEPGRRQIQEQAPSIDPVKTGRHKRALDSFVPRESTGPYDRDLDEESPEYAIVEFLTFWQERNYGKMARRTSDVCRSSVNKLAGELRGEAELVQLRAFEIREIRHSGVARAEATVLLKGRTIHGDVQKDVELLAFRLTASGNAAMPDEEGDWLVLRKCVYDLMRA